MGGKSGPSPPDYKGAAEAQAQSSKEVTNMQTWANRPNQFTPWGSSQWSTQNVRDPATGQPVTQWTQNFALSPMAQQALNSQQAISAGRSDLAQTLLGRAQDEYGRPIQFGQTPLAKTPRADMRVRQRAEDAYYNRLKARLDPEWEQRLSDEQARLSAQGLDVGDQAWSRSMWDLNRGRTDAYEQAQQAAILGGGQEFARDFAMKMGSANYQNQLRQQEIYEELQRRGYSLNEINALLTGQQVAQPTMPGFTNATRADAANYLGAAQMQGQAAIDTYNAEQLAAQGVMSAVTSPFSFGWDFN